VAGLLTRAALVKAMLSQGADIYVAGVMDRTFVRLSPDLPLGDAIEKVSTAGCALVMDAGDRLVGMLTSEHLSEFILLRQAGMGR
jgi:CBS domain-containing protein